MSKTPKLPSSGQSSLSPGPYVPSDTEAPASTAGYLSGDPTADVFSNLTPHNCIGDWSLLCDSNFPKDGKFLNDDFNANASLFWKAGAEGAPLIGEPGTGGNIFEKAESSHMTVCCRVTFGNRVDKFRIMFSPSCLPSCPKDCPNGGYPSRAVHVDIPCDWEVHGSGMDTVENKLNEAMHQAPEGSGWSLRQVGFHGQERDWWGHARDHGDIQQLCRKLACEQIKKWREIGERTKVTAPVC